MVMKRLILYVTGILFIVIIWSILSFLFTNAIVPNPLKVVIHIPVLVLRNDLLSDLFITIMRAACGFLLAVAAGTMIGLLTGSILSAERILFVPVALIQASPPLLWIIPLILVIGTGGTAPTVLVFFVVLPLVIINIQEGMKSISSELKEVCRMYIPTTICRLTKLYIPVLAGYYRSIVVLGSMLALKSALIGEWFGAHNGIGRIINTYFYSFHMLSFYAVAAIFLVVTGCIAWCVKRAASFLFKRRPSAVIPSQKIHIELTRTPSAAKQFSMEHVDFAYNEKTIFSDLCFSLTMPQTILLTGKSGAGKTTFAKLATGLLREQKGTIIRTKRPCLFFQENTFLPHLDCFGNAFLPLCNSRDPYHRELARFYCEQCGLEDHLLHFPDQLSGGLKKRLALARALVFGPDFIVVDEPFNSLHRKAREELWELVFSLFSQRNITLIIITHYPEELAYKKLTHYMVEKGTIQKIP
jgi:NitT/TauT family transport system permease protein